jgi:predicted transposase YbfD/YdcC
LEQGHQRLTYRTVKVFDCLTGIAEDWVGLAALCAGAASGHSPRQTLQPMEYYITSLATTAHQLAQGIQGHWGIENRLHWVKDVVFQEDDCPLKLAQAPQN